MKKYIYMAVAAIAALSSCSSDNELLTGETGKKALTFTATMEGSATRATYNSTEKCAAWEEGDQISINGKTYNAQSAGLTTTFKAVGEEAGKAPYYAYFACSYDGTTATLPAAVSETWADGKFNMPMYATSDDTNLEFKNLCGVLKITVKSDQIAAVKSIKVSSATKAVSGAFSVNGSNAAVLSEPNAVSNTLTVTYTDAVATTPEGKVFYVAVPAQTYQKLKIELSADGTNFTKCMTTKSETDITVERSKIYPITFAGLTQYSVTFNRSDFYFDGDEAAAENSDILLYLYLDGASWGDDNQFKGDGILQIDEYGATITEIVYTGSDGSTTKTDDLFEFEVEDGYVMDGPTNLGNKFVSVTVKYTKE